MKLQRLMALAVGLLVADYGAASALSAGPPSTPPPATQRMTLANASITMDEAVKKAEQRFHARVVKAETQRGDGHVVYVLRLLNDSGQVWTVRVDAASGTVL